MKEFIAIFILIWFCCRYESTTVYLSDEKLNYTNSASINRFYGNIFQIVNEWKYLDFEYVSYAERQRAIKERAFIPENNLPLGIDMFNNRVFITTPRWKDGVPATLSTLPYPPKELSPPLRPYPNWDAHSDPSNPDCTKIISVYRVSIDKCKRLWAIDSGIVSLKQICPPKVLAFDLDNDQWIVSYEIPSDQVKEDSLHSNILADIPNDNCNEAYIYVTDVWRFGLVVYSLEKNRSWRVTNYNFLPNPPASDFNLYGLNFQWLDGIFGLSISYKPDNYKDRILYFHPMANNKEFAVSTSLLNDESLWPDSAQNVSKYFVEIGDRGAQGQSSTSGITYNGVMFFTQVHQDNVGCWDTGKPYIRNNLRLILDKDQNLVTFPNDLKIDKQIKDQGIWIMSNRLPIFLYGQLNYNEINFRVLRANVDEAIAGTVCDPTISVYNKLKAANVVEGQCF